MGIAMAKSGGPGVYYYTLTTDNYSASKSFILVK